MLHLNDLKTKPEYETITGKIRNIRSRIDCNGQNMIEIFIDTTESGFRAKAYTVQANSLMKLKSMVENIISSKKLESVINLKIIAKISGFRVRNKFNRIIICKIKLLSVLDFQYNR